MTVSKQDLLINLIQNFVLWQATIESDFRVDSVTEEEKLDLIEMFTDSALHSEDDLLRLKGQIKLRRALLVEVTSDSGVKS